MNWKDVLKFNEKFNITCKMNRKGCKKKAIGFVATTGKTYCSNKACKEMAEHGFTNRMQERLQ